MFIVLLEYRQVSDQEKGHKIQGSRSLDINIVLFIQDSNVRNPYITMHRSFYR